MAKLTLLDIVQNILDENDGDAVNSISDTVDSQSVANTVRQVFLDLVSELDLPSLGTLGSLEGLGDTEKPNFMQIPENVSKVLWIKYDSRITFESDKLYRDVAYKEPLDFVTYVNHRPSNDTTNYQTVFWQPNTPLIIAKHKAPQFWTSFNDDLIIFDSYDANVDASLQASKSLCMFNTSPDLVVADDTVPNLPDHLHRLLYTQALARCSANLRSELNPKAERNENRMRVRSQRSKWREGRMIKRGPSYGRK